MKSKLTLVLAFLALTIFCHTLVFAEDELYLCGIVEKVIPQEGKIRFDVSSNSCNGVRDFKLPAVNTGEAFEVGNRKCFFINSNECKDGHVYRITKTERG